jgi:hypothetical protein
MSTSRHRENECGSEQCVERGEILGEKDYDGIHTLYF